MLRFPRTFGELIRKLWYLFVALLQVRNFLASFEKDGLNRSPLLSPLCEYAPAVGDDQGLSQLGIVPQPPFTVVAEADQLSNDGAFRERGRCTATLLLMFHLTHHFLVSFGSNRDALRAARRRAECV